MLLRETSKPRTAPGAVEGIQEKHGLSERHACRIVGQPRNDTRLSSELMRMR